MPGGKVLVHTAILPEAMKYYKKFLTIIGNSSIFFLNLNIEEGL